MTDLVTLIGHHGYLVLFLVVLGEALGLPLPAAIALVAAGAAAASHALRPAGVFGIAVVALLLGDSLVFLLGRYMGWNLLGFLCRVSVNPETCILRSAESFYKRGKVTLVMAKFIPGVNTMAPPLAGSMKMRYAQFLWLDLAGASLYTLAYSTLGYVFRDLVASLTRGFQTAGHVVEIVVVLGLVAYAGYRIGVYHKNRIFRMVPRVQVEELARRLRSEEAGKILLGPSYSPEHGAPGIYNCPFDIAYVH